MRRLVLLLLFKSLLASGQVLPLPANNVFDQQQGRAAGLTWVQPTYFPVTLTNNAANGQTLTYTEPLPVFSNVLYLTSIYIQANADTTRSCVMTNSNGCVATLESRNVPSGTRAHYVFSFKTNTQMAATPWMVAFSNNVSAYPNSSSIAMIGITNPGLGALTSFKGRTNTATDSFPSNNFSQLQAVGSNVVVFLSGRPAPWFAATSNANSGLITVYDTGVETGVGNYIAVCTNSPVSALTYSVTASNSSNWSAFGLEIAPAP